MILCDTGRAISIASIPVAYALGDLTIVQLYLVSAIEGTLYVFFNIAEAACLPRVVPKEQLPAATAQNMATDGITALIGPPLGGALYTMGKFLPFVADAISYAISVISLFLNSTWFTALITPLYAIAPNPLLLGILTAASFIVVPIYNVVQFSYRSAIIPDELQGRVNSVFRLIAFGGQPLGLALTGVLIQKIGVIQTVFICTLGMVAFALAANLNKLVRNAQPLNEVGNVG